MTINRILDKALSFTGHKRGEAHVASEPQGKTFRMSLYTYDDNDGRLLANAHLVVSQHHLTGGLREIAGRVAAVGLSSADIAAVLS